MLDLFYLMIPAYIANMAPVFARKIPWNTPLDFGLTFRNRRILGDNKTWRGLIVGVIVGTLIGVLISKIYWNFGFSAFTWSLHASFGALMGDAVKSFFKRRFNVSSGKSWFPFDQIDFTVGALAIGSFVYFPGWFNSAVIVLVSAIGHVAVNHFAYYTGIRGEKW